MINFNTGSSYLQSQIISGFDSVAQGFITTGSTSNPTGLQAALDSFSSFETMNLTSLGSNQLIAGVGEFSNPTSYLNNQLAESVIQKEDPLLSALQDSHLSIRDELSNFNSILTKFASSNSFPLANATAAMGIVIEERKGTDATANKGPLANATAAMGIIIEERKGAEATANKGPLANPTAAMGIVIEERNLTTFANMSESVRKAANLYQAANLSMLSKRITS